MNIVWTIVLVLASITPPVSSTTVREGSTIRVEVPGRNGLQVNVTVSGTATAGLDYNMPGEQETLPFDVATVDDQENEVTLETLNINLESTQGDFNLEYFIEDNDAVIINASDTTFVEGETATINLTCTIPIGSNSFTFEVVAFDITATHPDDFMFQSETFTCTSSSPTVPVDIPLVENSVLSPDQTFGLSVNSEFTVSGDMDLTVTILDNDAPTCNPPCQHGGSCNSGRCQCVDGYTGSFCESKDC